jgi:hypothetical protein
MQVAVRKEGARSQDSLALALAANNTQIALRTENEQT